MATPLAVGVDIGGTHLRAAVVDDTGALHAFVKQPTATASNDALVNQIVTVVTGLHVDGPVGVAIAGLVDAAGRLRVSPNLPALQYPLTLKDTLQARLNRPVWVGNDASLAALGEHRFGVATDVTSLLLVTIGTGVGAGLIVNGALLAGVNGFAGELGHSVLNPLADATKMSPQTLETYVSATGIAARAGMSTPELLALAEAGDQAAQAVLKDTADVLGVALANVVNLLDVAVCVIGGGAGVALYSFLEQPVRDAFATHVLGAGSVRDLPALRCATLGDTAGVIGAAVWAANQR